MPAVSVDWSPLPAPRPGLRAVIVLPARNQAKVLVPALAALAAQQIDPALRFEVLLLAHNCSDATADVARRFAADCKRCAIHVVEAQLSASYASAGFVRKALMDEACWRLTASGSPDGVILSSDADVRVDPLWLAATLRAVDAGADAVGGRILTESVAALPRPFARVRRLDALYRLRRTRLESLIDPCAEDPWPRHDQHFSASLAVTAAAYRRVGGVPRVRFMEDEALVRTLRREDLRIRHAPDVRVWTAARLDSWADIGATWQLREWADRIAAGEQPTVAHPHADVARWTRRRAARQMWSQRPGSVRGETFARFWERLEGRDAESAARWNEPLPLGEAVRVLRGLLRERQGRPAQPRPGR